MWEWLRESRAGAEVDYVFPHFYAPNELFNLKGVYPAIDVDKPSVKYVWNSKWV